MRHFTVIIVYSKQIELAKGYLLSLFACVWGRACVTFKWHITTITCQIMN